MTLYLKYELLFCRCRSLQLLLDKSGAMLVLRELHYVVGQVTQLKVGIAVIPKQVHVCYLPIGSGYVYHI